LPRNLCSILKREQEHQQKWPKGHIKKVGRIVTEQAAREGEKENHWFYLLISLCLVIEGRQNLEGAQTDRPMAVFLCVSINGEWPEKYKTR